MNKDELTAEVMMLRMLLTALIEVAAGDASSRAHLSRIVREERNKALQQPEPNRTVVDRIFLRKLEELQQSMGGRTSLDSWMP